MSDPFGCSTFVVPGRRLIGHNIDMPYAIPGMVMTTPRGLRKRSISYHELITGEPDADVIEWDAKYGAITFNPFTLHFNDGGINEAGLAVHEMTLNATRFPDPDGRPVLFECNWMQSVLDRFATVEEVLADLDDIVIDGWAWHFLVSDRSGDKAVIAFLDGEKVIHRAKTLPIPVLCNTTYAAELEGIARYDGFGGDLAIDVDDHSIERFVHGAFLVGRLNVRATTQDAFDVLAAMERGQTQWSWVIDDDERTVSWRTSVQRDVKHFTMNAIDFGGPSVAVDVDTTGGDVTTRLQPVDETLIRELAHRTITALDADGGVTELLNPFRQTPAAMADRMAAYALSAGRPASPTYT
jgi:choloylglycine hydrolase